MAEPQRRPQNKPPLFDEAAVARAEEALKALSGHFQEWLEEEVTKLQASRIAARAANWSEASLHQLYVNAHDLKGLGSTYEYPLATRIAGSLCRMLETAEGRRAAKAQPGLVDAHVDAIRAAARDQIRSSEHPLGKQVLRTLEGCVDALGLSPAA